MKQVVMLVMAALSLAACAPAASETFTAGTMGRAGPFNAADAILGCEWAAARQLSHPPSAATFERGEAPQKPREAWVYRSRITYPNSAGVTLSQAFRCVLRPDGEIRLAWEGNVRGG